MQDFQNMFPNYLGKNIFLDQISPFVGYTYLWKMKYIYLYFLMIYFIIPEILYPYF